MKNNNHLILDDRLGVKLPKKWKQALVELGFVERRTGGASDVARDAIKALLKKKKAI